jgi:hypothetical protein
MLLCSGRRHAASAPAPWRTLRLAPLGRRLSQGYRAASPVSSRRSGASFVRQHVPPDCARSPATMVTHHFVSSRRESGGWGFHSFARCQRFLFTVAGRTLTLDRKRCWSILSPPRTRWPSLLTPVCERQANSESDAGSLPGTKSSIGQMRVERMVRRGLDHDLPTQGVGSNGGGCAM